MPEIVSLFTVFSPHLSATTHQQFCPSFIADNLDMLRGRDSETVNLIYLDPPFDSD